MNLLKRLKLFWTLSELTLSGAIISIMDIDS